MEIKWVLQMVAPPMTPHRMDHRMRLTLRVRRARENRLIVSQEPKITIIAE
jgi:hypothetical protein